MNRDEPNNYNARYYYEPNKINNKKQAENDEVVVELNCQHLLRNYPCTKNYLDVNLEINWPSEEIKQNPNYENRWNVQALEHKMEEQERKERYDDVEWNEKHWFEDKENNDANTHYYNHRKYEDQTKPNDNYYNNNDVFYDSTHYFVTTNNHKEPKHCEKKPIIDNSNIYNNEQEKESSISSNESYCSEYSDQSRENGKNKFMNFSHRITYNDKELLRQLEADQYNKIENIMEEEPYNEIQWNKDNKTRDYKRKSKSNYYENMLSNEYDDKLRSSLDKELQINHLEENLPYISNHETTTDIHPFLVKKLRDIYERSLERHSTQLDLTNDTNNDSHCRIMDEDILNKYEKIVRIMLYLKNLKVQYPEMRNIVSLLSKDVKIVAYQLEQMFFSVSELRHFLKKLYISQIFLLKKVVKKPKDNKENELSTCIIHNSPRHSMRFNSIEPLRQRESTKNYYGNTSRRNYSMIQPSQSKKLSKMYVRNEYEPMEPLVEPWERTKKNSNYKEVDSEKKCRNEKKKNSEQYKSFQENIYDNKNKWKQVERNNERNSKKYSYYNEEINTHGKTQSTKNEISWNREKKPSHYENMIQEHVDRYSQNKYNEHVQNKKEKEYYDSCKNVQDEENIYEKKEEKNMNRKKQTVEDLLYKVSSRMSSYNKNDQITKINEKHLSFIEEQLEKIQLPKENKTNSQRKQSNTLDNEFNKKQSRNNQEKKKSINIHEPERKAKNCLLTEFNRNHSRNPSKTFVLDKNENANSDYKKDQSNQKDTPKENQSKESFEYDKDTKILLQNFEKNYPEKGKNKSENEPEEKKTHVFYVDVNKEISTISNRESIIHALKHTLLNKPKNYKNLRDFLFKIEVELVEYKNFVLLITKDIRKPHLEALYGLNDFSVYEKVLGKKKAPRLLVSSKVKFFYKYDIFYKIFRELTFVRDFSGITDAVKLI